MRNKKYIRYAEGLHFMLTMHKCMPLRSGKANMLYIAFQNVNARFVADLGQALC